MTQHKSAPKAAPKTAPKPAPNAAPQPKADRPKGAPSTATRCGTVAIVGRPNVGKSTLLNALLGEKIAAATPKPQTTRRALRGVCTAGDAQLVLVDTPGLHRPKKGMKGALHSFMLDEALDAARGVDVIAFVVEAGAGGRGIAAEDEAALDQLERALAQGKPADGEASARTLVLVVNKVDRLKDKAALLPLLEAWSKRAGVQWAAYVPVSAKAALDGSKHSGVDVLIAELAKHLPQAPFLFPPDSLTDASERDICAELVRERLMLELTDELPYRAAVVVEEFDESRRDSHKPLVSIHAVIHVEKDSQKAIVIGKGGARLKSIGTRARASLERLLGCQVMLKLFVRVEPDWTLTKKGIARVGYSR